MTFANNRSFFMFRTFTSFGRPLNDLRKSSGILRPRAETAPFLHESQIDIHKASQRLIKKHNSLCDPAVCRCVRTNQCGRK